MRYVLIGSVLVGAVLLLMLAVATSNTSRFAGFYPLLVTVNLAGAILLACLVIYQIYRLARGVRKRRFGSRLTARFVALFALMALIPGALVYTVSVQFLTKSIESWFDVRVDSALEGGLNLGRAMLDNMLNDLTAKATTAALDLGEVPAPQQPLALNRIREQAGVDEVALVATQGVIASARGSCPTCRRRPRSVKRVRAASIARSRASASAGSNCACSCRSRRSRSPRSRASCSS
jgi:nitrogen fixation/metabolism regulation signal transduction histidine kinase